MMENNAETPAKHRIWTLRRALGLVAAALVAAMFAGQAWVSHRYADFAVATFNDSAANTAALLITDRVRNNYVDQLYPHVNDWSRDMTLVDALGRGDAAKAVLGLKTILTRQAVADGDIKLAALHAFDPEMNRVATVAELSGETATAAPERLARLKQRSPDARRQPVTVLWRSAAGRPLVSLIVPVGGFRAVGFIEVAADPLAVLNTLGAALHADIRIKDDAGQVVFESPAGGEKSDATETSAAYAVVPGGGGRAVGAAGDRPRGWRLQRQRHPAAQRSHGRHGGAGGLDRPGRLSAVAHDGVRASGGFRHGDGPHLRRRRFRRCAAHRPG